MKNAIIILVHQLPEQVNIFLNQLLKATDMDIYIHINKRCDSLREQLLKDERIIIPSDNVEITWGSDEILKAILLMFRHIQESGRVTSKMQEEEHSFFTIGLLGIGSLWIQNGILINY